MFSITIPQQYRQSRKVAFKAKIEGLSEDEQPRVEIEIFNNLQTQDLSDWTENFRYIQKTCGWSQEQSNTIILTFIDPSILKLIGQKRTAHTIIQALMEQVYPETDYRR